MDKKQRKKKRTKLTVQDAVRINPDMPGIPEQSKPQTIKDLTLSKSLSTFVHLAGELL